MSHTPSPTTRPRRGWQSSMVAVVVSLALVAGACASGETATQPLPGGFEVRGSVEQLSVEGVPGATVIVSTGSGDEVDRGVLDAAGGRLWRDLAPGDYSVTVENGDASGTARVTVTSPADTPDPSLYTGQTLEAGFNYLTTRDGTKLGAMVTLPTGASISDGPFPTLVEYSGYDLSNPFNVSSGSSPFRLIAPFLGYALVQVQMRGTGCSGGAFDYFEPLQSLDGYDAVETVAAQSWVSNNEVGMVGISYPGISQLFVAETRPPSLVAITPLSVIADTGRSTLRPGGIFNNGFALDWAQGRMRDSRPAPDGQQWVATKIAGDPATGFEPDPQCAANQRLHGQAVDLPQRIDASTFATPENAYLSPERFVNRIEAATFMVGAWQDEQTGGQWAYLLDSFNEDTYLRAIGQNGSHIEAFAPENLHALFEFLDLFVKKDVPSIPGTVRQLAGVLYAEVLGSAPPAGASTELPADRFAGMTYDEALADYLAEDPIIIRFDNGAGPTGAQAGFFGASESISLPRWPLADLTPWELYLSPDGELSPSAPAGGDDAVSYAYDSSRGARTSWTGAPGCQEWLPNPTGDDGASCYQWQDAPAGQRASFVSPVLTGNKVMVGSGVVDLWLASDATDTDVEVVLTEVRPDGQEMYVQSGWLRASQRKLDTELSRPLAPWPTHAEADVSPLVPGEFTQMQVGIFPFAHVFRAGSKVRLTVTSPGGNRILWKFDSLTGAATNTVGTSAAHPSRMLLPVVPDVTVTTSLPPCVLRAQPCRPAS
jgi:uncharacterized protein